MQYNVPLLTQCFYVYNLLYSLSCEDERRIFLHANTVLYAYSDAAEMLRPSFIIWDIYPRFYSHAVTLSEGNGPWVSRAIMNVQADVVAYMVREEHL